MPVAVEILLLDQDADGAAGKSASLARCVYNEIERQLQDPNSHLRRKSAFGALVSRGAKLRQLGHERVDDGAEDAGVVKPVCPSSLGLAAQGGRAHAEEQRRVPAAAGGEALASRAAADGITKVPKILDFPKPPSRPTVAPSAMGFDLFGSLLSWIPSCTPATCRGLQGQAMDSCTIVVPEAELRRSYPSSGGARGVDFSPAVDLTGWPLCVPHAYVAILPQGEEQLRGSAGSPPGALASVAAMVPTLGDCAMGGMEADAVAALGDILAAPAGSGFHMAAVEVDDFEFVVNLVPNRGGATACSTGRGRYLRTPSTAPTSAGGGSEVEESGLPTWVKHNRMAFPRERICGFQAWPATGSGRCGTCSDAAPTGTPPPWPHLLEVTGTPRGAPRAVSLLMALQSAQLASRMAEALTRVRRERAARSSGTPSFRSTARGAVRCELRIDVDFRQTLSGEGAVNCAAVVRRGISEACHVGAERVRVCAVRDMGSEAAAAQPQAPAPAPGGAAPPNAWQAGAWPPPPPRAATIAAAAPASVPPAPLTGADGAMA